MVQTDFVDAGFGKFQGRDVCEPIRSRVHDGMVGGRKIDVDITIQMPLATAEVKLEILICRFHRFIYGFDEGVRFGSVSPRGSKS
jgi:hypothetical protein